MIYCRQILQSPMGLRTDKVVITVTRITKLTVSLQSVKLEFFVSTEGQPSGLSREADTEVSFSKESRISLSSMLK